MSGPALKIAAIIAGTRLASQPAHKPRPGRAGRQAVSKVR